MKKREGKEGAAPSERIIRRSAFVTVISDVFLILALAACLFVYASQNNVRTYNQNVESITSIARAESELLQAALDSTGSEVLRAYRFCEGKGADEILAYLSDICAGEEEYQLLRRDEGEAGDPYPLFTGFSTKTKDGAFLSVQYRNTALADSLYSALSTEDGVISFSQSFTNKTDALRYYAVFCPITIGENGVSHRYFLVKPQKENRVLNQLQMYAPYADIALAVCYADGKYLACDNGFRSDNFYDYVYKYNDLSIDQRNAVRAAVQADEDGVGALIYKDYKGRECVFAYAACGDGKDWYIFTAVPRSEFITENLLSFFPLTIIGFLVALLAFNIWRLLLIVNELRRSVARERIANASKSSFLSRMSHEIRTPLNAVIGYNAIAKSEMSAAEDDAQRRQAEMKVMDCLTKSEIASKHLLTIINDVLDMSAIESGKIQVEQARFDFRGLITSLTTVFYSQARAKGVNFEVLLTSLSEEWFIGDQMRINQILTNLLSNAIKFTPEGGSVTLHIYQPEAESNAPHVHFDVIDTGIGMSEEYLTHIFTPFEQEDSSISRRFGGTGLGLSITKSLVDLMGGTISVKSTPGKGSTFSVDLTFAPTSQPLDTRTYDFSGVNALVVDDDPATCDYIRLLFNRCGARCASVTSGADAVKAYSLALEQNDAFTLCLVDWRMPEMDGLTAIRHIRELTGADNVPIIVLTAYDYTEIADEAARAGVSRFLSKPLFQSSLFDLLASQNSAQPSPRRTGKKARSFDGARVLLAEDNTMNMEIAKAVLLSAGLLVDGVWNGQEALNAYLNNAPGTYKAILMDVHMPIMDGHAATRAIRASGREDAATVPIIAMTADAFAENVAEARAAGMDDHIAKPIDIPSLLNTLNKYIK